MKLFYYFIAFCFLLNACSKEKPILTDNDVKSVIESGLSHEKFFPLLKSMQIDTFNLQINKKIMDSIHVQGIVVFINPKKSLLGMERKITAEIDSIAPDERKLKLICGDFEPPNSKILGTFKMNFVNHKWVLIPIDIGIADYR